MTRCAADRRVFFVEEPELGGCGSPWLELKDAGQGIRLAIPHLPQGISDLERTVAQRKLLESLFATHAVSDYLFWYYTPMALPFTDHFTPRAIVYDCMDELSAFRGAPPELGRWEAQLLDRADLVLTGGVSLYEAKRDRHPNVHAFPSSVDVAHFAQARRISHDPADQASVPLPRLGFMGVIDERMDLALVAGIAEAQPQWHLVFIGPVVKIDRASLPIHPNIHYLGMKPYDELPAYLGGWNVALMPFAQNEATRFISPTKTPEYLAAGKPVVSTPIRDVVRPYGERGLVRIAGDVRGFVSAVNACLAEAPGARQEEVDAFLGQGSWDQTWTRVEQLVAEVVRNGKGHV
jgi:glycosyltransferase involved in cell wall biosynthesis